MPWKSAVWAVVAILAGFVAYQQTALGNQLDALERKLGEMPAPSAAAPKAANPRRASGYAASHDGRLGALERAVTSLQREIRTLEQATGETPETLVSDQQILTVMKDHGSKIVEGQIKYHRQRWLDQREEGLAEFTKRYNLTREESDALWGLLSREVDQMIEILRDPESFENPERAAEQWKKMLYETDVGAHRTLDPQRSVAWDQVRWLERKILWPWLPE